MRKIKPIVVIQGGNWGSEAKGVVSEYLGRRLGVDYAVRTGAINAGHTLYNSGQRYVMQQLPCCWTNPGSELVLGPGAYIHEPTLRRELALSGIPRSRLRIDFRAGVHLDSYEAEAKAADRRAKIGATGKGCAEAILHKIADRGVRDDLVFSSSPQGGPYLPCFTDTVQVLNEAYDLGGQILLEGTQGSLLDFHTGPWPYVTSRQTQASAWVTEAGLSPTLDYAVWLVVRTFPIRVAGNSGPLPREIDWPVLARHINRKVSSGHPMWTDPEALREFEAAKGTPTERLNSLSPEVQRALALFERTTVTKNVRRVAEIDLPALRRTARAERPTAVALTFLNYVFPELYGESKLHGPARQYLARVEEATGARVLLTNTGPLPEHVIDLGVRVP